MWRPLHELDKHLPNKLPLMVQRTGRIRVPQEEEPLRVVEFLPAHENLFPHPSPRSGIAVVTEIAAEDSSIEEALKEAQKKIKETVESEDHTPQKVISKLGSNIRYLKQTRNLFPSTSE